MMTEMAVEPTHDIRELTMEEVAYVTGGIEAMQQFPAQSLARPPAQARVRGLVRRPAPRLVGPSVRFLVPSERWSVSWRAALPVPLRALSYMISSPTER